MDNPHNRIYWIGGSSCSGKSTVAALLAANCAYALYQTDETAFGKYMFAIDDEKRYPAIVAYRNLILEGIESFAKRDPGYSFRAFCAYCAEVFPLLLEDIHGLAQSNGVVVEGAHLFPECITSHAPSRQAIFLTCTPEQQRSIWRKEMNQEIPGGHEAEIQSYRAARNKTAIEDTRIAFHDLIADHLRKQAVEHDFKQVLVGTDSSLDQVKCAVFRHFGVPGH